MFLTFRKFQTRKDIDINRSMISAIESGRRTNETVIWVGSVCFHVVGNSKLIKATIESHNAQA